VASTGTARGTYLEVPGMDHLLTRNGAFADDVWDQVMTWTRARLRQ